MADARVMVFILTHVIGHAFLLKKEKNKKTKRQTTEHGK